MKKLTLATIFLCSVVWGQTYAHDTSSCTSDEIFIKEYATCLGYQWIEGPYLNGRGERTYSTLRLTFDTHRELDLQKANIYPWMIMHGGHQHGARPVEIEVIDNTEIMVRKILFTQMNGKWFVRINLDAKMGDRPETDFEAEIAL